MKADRESDSDDAIDDRDDRPARSGPALSSEKPGTTTAGHVIVVLLSLTMLAPIAAAGFGTYWMAREWMGKKSTTMLAGPTGSSSVTGSGTPLGSGSRTNSNVTPAKKANDWPMLSPKATITTSFDDVDAFLLSADGKRLLINGQRNKANLTEVWELAPTPKRILNRPVVARAMSPDGKLIAVTVDDNTEVYAVDNYARLSTIAGQSKLRFCANDKLVSSVSLADDGGKIKLTTFDAMTGNKANEFEIATGPPFALKMEWGLNGGKDLLIALERDPRIEVWDVVEGKKKVSSTLPGQTSSSFDYWDVSSDGKFLRTKISKDRAEAIYEVATGNVRGIVKETFLSPRLFAQKPILIGRVLDFANGRDFTGYRVFDFANNKVLAELNEPDLKNVLSADNSVFVVQKDHGSYVVFDLSPILK